MSHHIDRKPDNLFVESLADGVDGSIKVHAEGTTSPSGPGGTMDPERLGVEEKAVLRKT